MVTPMTIRPSSRSGTILIIVAGLSGLLASIALAFLARVQSNCASDQEVMQEAQARIMLVAACHYIQEASRLGWESPDYHGRWHIETYGWIDVRDGGMGPKYNSSSSTLDAINAQAAIPEAPFRSEANTSVGDLFPIGIPQRFSMHLLQRPPYAIKNKACYNPVITDPQDSDYTGLNAYLRYPDPLPSVDNGWSRSPSNPAGGTNQATMDRMFPLWAAGDRTPRAETVGIAWFRLLREPSGAVFLVTVGAGGTMGWRSWKELTAGDPQFAQQYFGSENAFLAAQGGETRHWYRVEWSPAVTPQDNHMIFHGDYSRDNYRIWHPNGGTGQGQFLTTNFGGTIQWTQRLREEPATW